MVYISCRNYVPIFQWAVVTVVFRRDAKYL